MTFQHPSFKIWFRNNSKEHIICKHRTNWRPPSLLIYKWIQKVRNCWWSTTFQLQYKNLPRLKIFNCITCALTSKENTISCFCGSTTKKAWLPQQKYSCIVEFDKDSDFVLATLFSNMLKEVFPVDNLTKDEMQTFLLEMKNFQMTLDTEGTPMNTTDLTLKYFS